MKYTSDERINIGRQVITHELSREDAMEKYQIGHGTLDRYIHLYKESAGIPTKKSIHSPKGTRIVSSVKTNASSSDIDAYMAMSK